MSSPRARRSKRTDTSANEVWRRLFGLVIASHSRRDLLLERLGLTAGDGRALSSLDSRSARSIGSLADEWRCDPSTATRSVDRLEARGLAERRSVNGDRRVRAVALTSHGVRVKAKLIAGLLQPPQEFTTFTATQLEALLRALQPLPDIVAAASASPVWRQPQPGLEIRPLLPGYEERVLAAGRLFQGAPMREATKRFLVDPGHHLLIAYQDAAPAGFIEGIEQTQPDKGTEMFVAELAVDQMWRGRGIGKLLVERLTEIARDRGCYGMWAVTDDSNAGAQTIYTRAGATSRQGQVLLSWELNQNQPDQKRNDREGRRAGPGGRRS